MTCCSVRVLSGEIARKKSNPKPDRIESHWMESTHKRMEQQPTTEKNSKHPTTTTATHNERRPRHCMDIWANAKELL